MYFKRWMVSVSAAVATAAILAGCNNNTPDISTEEMEEAGASRSNAVNSKAPGFTLRDQDGQSVSLSDYRGKWVVLYFYPKDDTPGCVCQATEFTELLFKFQDMNAKVIGVNADSPEQHRRFTKKYDLALTLLSDPDHDVMKTYGASVGGVFGGPRRIVRQTYIIDPDGVIRYHFTEVIPKGHAERVKEKLAELQKRYGHS
jgi:peroxiredoxin Q/BCP